VNNTIEFLFKQPKVLKSIAFHIAKIYNADLKDTAIFDSLLKQQCDNEKAITNLLKALEMGIFSPSTKQRLDELEKAKEDIDCELLLQYIFKAKPITEKTVYSYFLSFKDLDYTVQKNRERLIELFVRKVVLFDNDKPDGDKMDIYYNISGDVESKSPSRGGVRTKENAESETEFGFGALGNGQQKVS
jgi:hypothetical protein